MPASTEIIFGTQRLVLLADRALHWPTRQTLVLADVHLGKDASFRAAGLPVPAGNSAKDLARIEALLSLTGAARLIILGDLVHNRASHQPELAAAFSAWRALRPRLEILLIRGNHDRHAGPPPPDWHISQVSERLDTGAIALAHMPQPSEKPLLCGHVHPTVAVRDFDRSFAAIPCFVADPAQLILPAFGSFIGGYKVRPEPQRKIYAVTGNSVVLLPDTIEKA
ncbi:MAG: ligase-associated DNA damage response endonuclease PdeM [Planctomycetota bacterium]|nr:ligase-associated DNA damage response endonuclease PdeM [Planctomycetota bacterium]